MTRCEVCVLPDTYSAVTFGEDGICSLCRDDEALVGKERSEQETCQDKLNAIVLEARERDGEYDCIVPVSGGRDSSYVACFMTRRLGLRALGVNYDNGYRSPYALSNLERISSRLGMSLVTLKPESALFQRVFAHFLKTTGYLCAACDAIGYIVVGSFLAREARRTGRRSLVVGGWSRKYEYQPGLSVLSMKSFGDILRRDRAMYDEVRENPLVERAVFDAFISTGDIRQGRPGRSKDKAPGGAVPGLVQLPDYVDWDYEEIENTLQRELGWGKPEGHHGAHFDCLLSPIPVYLKNRKFGFCQETIRNSVLVREGRITRDEAIRRIESVPTTEPPVFREVLAEWGMTTEEVAWDAEWST